ncbi:MAG TPA: aminoglycoside phosphotransferase family protein, partial [Candidatus Limnocylindria bacterium]
MTLDAVLDAWGWSDPVPIAETPTSGVFRVRRPGGETAVVKALTPAGDRDERIGADFLAWREGRGAVRLLARSGPYLLLEDAGPTSLLDELDALGDDAAIAIAAEVVRTLHAPGGPSPLLPSLESHFGSLFARATSEPRLADHADTARALLGAQRDVR